MLSQQRRLPTLAGPHTAQDADAYLALFCPSLSVHPRFVPAAPFPFPPTALTKIYSLTQHFQRHQLRVPQSTISVRRKHPHITNRKPVYPHSFHVITSPCTSDSWSRFLCIISLSRDGNSLLHSILKIVKSCSPPPFDDSLSNAHMKMGVLPDGRRQSVCGWVADGDLLSRIGYLCDFGLDLFGSSRGCERIISLHGI